MAADNLPEKATAARRLLRGLDRATLATRMADWPYASLVLVAVDHDAAPLLLVSDLAQHTVNLKAEPRCSLLFDGTAGLDEPLTGARVTILGRAERVADERLRARYRARHPSSGFYAGFADFHLYRIAPERGHLVAGFGRIDWIPGEALLFPAAPALAAAEAGILAHMNEDHADAVRLYATALLGQPDGAWHLTGIDPEGADLRCGGKVARLDFAAPVHDAETARRELVRLVDEARRRP